MHILRIHSTYWRSLSCICLLAIAQSAPCAPPDSAPLSLAGAGQISADVLDMLFSHQIDEDTELRESMKGGVTVGNAHTEGNVSLRFFPNPEVAEFAFLMNANVRVPNSVSTRGGVNVYGSSATRIQAQKRVTVDQGGLETVPADARSQTEIRIRNVSTDRRRFERMVRRRTTRSKPDVERTVEQRTSRTFEERLDERIGAAMTSFDQRIRQQLGYPVTGDFSYPDTVSFRSTDRHLQALIESAADSPTPLTLPTELDPDLDLQAVVHSSLIELMVERQWGGNCISDEEILARVERLRGTAPWALRVYTGRPRWSVTLATEQPLQLTMTNGEVDVRLQFSAVQMGDEVLQAPLVVQLKIRPELTEDGPCLRCLWGPYVELEPVASKSTAEEAEPFLQLLNVKFAAVFPAEFYFDGMRAPVGGSWNRVHELQPTHLTIQDGWLDFGYRFLSPSPTPDNSSDSVTSTR